MKKVSVYAIGSLLSFSPAFAMEGNSPSSQCDNKPKACPCEPSKACEQCSEEKPASDATQSTLLTWLTKRLMERPRFSATLSVRLAPPSEQPNSTSDVADKRLGDEVSAGHASSIRPSDENEGHSITCITEPFTFSSSLSEGFEKLVDGVIACGHKICTESQCIVVEEDESQPAPEENASNPSEEPILMIPAAPPAPPVSHFASMNPPPATDELDTILEQSGLRQMDVPVPATQFVRLLVERAHLATRLEMTEQLMTERNVALEQIHALAERNAALAAQVAIAEVKQQLAETIHAQLAEKAEKAMQVALQSQEAEPLPEKGSKVIQDIQEDLSNIRKQIGLLRRQSPVPFAPSSLGRSSQPYQPTGKLLFAPVQQEAKQIQTETGTLVK